MGTKVVRSAGVVSEGWPVWLGVLPSLGYMLDYIYVPDRYIKFVKDLEQFKDATWIELNQVRNAQIKCSGLLYISGTLTFIESLVTRRHVELNNAVMAVKKCQRNKAKLKEKGWQVKWYWIKHKEVGGVTDAKVVIGVGLGLPQPCLEEV